MLVVWHKAKPCSQRNRAFGSDLYLTVQTLVFGGRLSHQPLEHAAEIAGCGETAVQGDVKHAAGCIGQHVRCLAHAAIGQIFKGRHFQHALEAAQTFARADSSAGGDLIEGQFLGAVFLYKGKH